MIKRFATLDAPKTLAELGQFRGIASTEAPGDDGLIIRTAGISYDRYEKNPVLLYDHDPSKPVGTVKRRMVDNNVLKIHGEFAPAGSSTAVDEVRALVASGVLRGLSIGFAIKESRPITVDGKRFEEVTKTELAEISVVAIPCLPDAVINERSGKLRQGSSEWLRARLREIDTDAEQEARYNIALSDHRRRVEAESLRAEAAYSAAQEWREARRRMRAAGGRW